MINNDDNDANNTNDIIVNPIISADASSLSRFSSNYKNNNNYATPASPLDDMFPTHQYHQQQQYQQNSQLNHDNNNVINTSSPIYQYCYYDIHIPSGAINFKINDSIECNNIKPAYSHTTR